MHFVSKLLTACAFASKHRSNVYSQISCVCVCAMYMYTYNYVGPYLSLKYWSALIKPKRMMRVLVSFDGPITITHLFHRVLRFASTSASSVGRSCVEHYGGSTSWSVLTTDSCYWTEVDTEKVSKAA